ncbi:flagellar filament capping protein FliD [Clostridium sp.]|uniref:flagellar filament capping protein FliD n=1 Tax=Clostridium sp. TaxID=1506 RepID=UPI003D6CF7A1
MASIYPSSNSTSSTSSANLMRISGMASGIDTDALVKSMVSNYQSKIDKANAAKQTVQWQQEGYREIIKGVKGLQDYFDPISSKNMFSENSLNVNTAVSEDASIVSATSGAAAKAGTYKVHVQHLAEQAKIEGKSQNSLVSVSNLADWTGKTLSVDVGTSKVDLANLVGTTTVDLVADINSKIAASDLNGKITASYVKEVTGGVTKEYIKFAKSAATTDSITLRQTGDNVDNRTGSTVIGISNDLTINSGISSSSKLSDLGLPSSISFSLSYNAATNTKPIIITASNTSTIKDLMDNVNSSTGGAVTMSIDDTTGKISFKSKDYGSASNFKIMETGAIGATDGMIAKLGLPGEVSVDAAGVTTKTITKTGIDAIVEITEPGQSTVTTTQSSNKFTTNGVTYNLVGVNKAGATSNVTVTANSDTVVSNMKKFIEDYNAIVSTINTKLTEKKDKNYVPLTDDQRTSMSETQIKTWEAKAKVGILRKDDYLSSLLTQLRGTLYSPVYNSYDKTNTSNGKIALNFGSYGASAIGIETSKDILDGGKLVLIDESKLKSAIENNMGDFRKLFMGASSSDLELIEDPIGSAKRKEPYIGSKKYNEDSIFKRMDNILRDYVAAPAIGKDGTYSLSGYMNIFVNKQYDFSTTGTASKNTLPDQVYGKTLSVKKLQAQLSAASTRYYAKFTALEKAMNKLNSQQSSLASMLGTSS